MEGYTKEIQHSKLPNKKRKKTGKIKRILISFLLIFMFLIGVLCLYVAYLLNQVDQTDWDTTDEDLGIDTTVWKNEDVIKIALFGVDSRQEKNEGRSDAIMIASFDAEHHKVKIVSIMRDSEVAVSGHGKTKINHAYAYGGAELAIKTLNQNFDLNIKDYITVNFYQLADVVDAIGGLEIEITEAERKYMNLYIKEAAEAVGSKYVTVKKSGLQLLTGEQVVAYARIRAVGNSDFRRTERQREIIEKVFEKVMASSALRYPTILNSILPMIETSMSNSDILGIASRVVMFGKPTFEQARFPLDGEYYSSNGRLVYNLDEASEKIRSFFYEDEPFYEIEQIAENDKNAPIN